MRPYQFIGTWSDMDADVLHQVMMRLGRASDVGPNFNTWTFSSSRSGWYSAYRQTWEFGTLTANTPQGLGDKIEQYYKSLNC